MLEEQAVVTAVQGDAIWVESSPTSSCSGCGQACAATLLHKQGARRRAPLSVECKLEVMPGDLVVIGIDERALLWGSLLVYMLPLCALLAGAALAELLAAWQGLQAEWPTLLGGVLGFASGVYVVKKLPWPGSLALRPVVLRKILR